jgi:ribosomal-protein-alanine N-acetyltransferase
MSAVARSPDAPRMRPMGYADIDSVMRVERAAYPFPWTEGIFRDCLRVGYSCWVFEDAQSEELQAYGVMSMGPGECHLLNLCVRPQDQAQGMGRQVLRALLERAGGFPVDSVFLEVRPSNEPAIQLYRSEGFNEVGVRKRYYPAAFGREDAIVMAKALIRGTRFDQTV